MKRITNIYYLVDCSCRKYGHQTRRAQTAVLKAKCALRNVRFSARIHLIGYNDKAMFLNAFRKFPVSGNPILREGLKMLKTVIEYQRKAEPQQTRSIFLFYSSGEVVNGWQSPLRKLFTLPEFAGGLRYVVTPQPLSEKEQVPFLQFADFPERVLPYFSENRLCSLIQTITFNR